MKIAKRKEKLTIRPAQSSPKVLTKHTISLAPSGTDSLAALRQDRVDDLESLSMHMSQHFVYILEAADGKYYVGYTIDLERRMAQHQEGRGAKFTRGFGFRKLLYHETFDNKSSALQREAELKSWTRAAKQALIDGAVSQSAP